MLDSDNSKNNRGLVLHGSSIARIQTSPSISVSLAVKPCPRRSVGEFPGNGLVLDPAWGLRPGRSIGRCFKTRV